MTDLQIRAKTVYSWSAEDTQPLPDKAKENRRLAGATYSVRCDPSVISLMSQRMDEVADQFAGKAKKKGFSRASDGLGGWVVGLTKETVTFRFTMSRTK